MPPLQFRRRPPQSNCPPDTVSSPHYGSRLDSRTDKGGISTLAPPQLALWLQSLPPILHISIQKSMSSYSKGARGLSVQLREAGIFTGTTNSLSLSSRQRPTRYAIHAGRNFTFITHFGVCRLYLLLVRTLRRLSSIGAFFSITSNQRVAASSPPLLSDQSLRGHLNFVIG